MTQIKYSVLRYNPNLVRAENIIVGVAVHVPEYKIARFFKIKNMSRVSTFDDEYDKEYFSMIMDALTYEFTFDIENLDNSTFLVANISDLNFLELRTQSFANEFRFDSVNIIESDVTKLDEDINKIVDLYLYYDKSPNDRITQQRAKALLSKQVKTAGLKKENSNVNGAFQNRYVFDFNINGVPTRTITFDYLKDAALRKYLKEIVFDIQTAVKESNINKINILTIHEEDFQQDFEQLKKYLNDIEDTMQMTITVTSLSNFSEILDR